MPNLPLPGGRRPPPRVPPVPPKQEATSWERQQAVWKPSAKVFIKAKKETKSKEEVLRRASCNSRAVGKRAQGYDMSVPLVALWRNLRNAQSWSEYHTQCLFFPACYKFNAGLISGPTRGIPAHLAGRRMRSFITGRVSQMSYGKMKISKW